MILLYCGSRLLIQRELIARADYLIAASLTYSRFAIFTISIVLVKAPSGGAGSMPVTV